MSEHRRYEILGVLGAGGFGTVYRARFVGEGGFTKEVALKVLKPDMEGVADVARRLRDEARVLGLLRHRAIVQVDRLTQLDGRWTVVMEYIEGQDLSRLIRLGPVPPGAALEITAEVAGALDAAWARPGPSGQPLRLVHRDLKPSNIRLTRYGEVKVLDFGIARAEFDSREAMTRSLSFGTPDYMSPERLDHQGDTSAGDVYALGCVLLEMLVARRLGRSSANAERHARRLDEAQRMLAEGQIPAPLCALVLRCLAYAPAERPTPAELERQCLALSRELGGEPLRAWADGRLALLPSPSSERSPVILASLTPPSSAQRPGEPTPEAPAALATAELEPVEVGVEDLTGSVLIEGPGAEPAPQTFNLGASQGLPREAAPASAPLAPTPTAPGPRRGTPLLVGVVLGLLGILWGAKGLLGLAEPPPQAPLPVVVEEAAAPSQATEPALEVPAPALQSPPPTSPAPAAPAPAPAVPPRPAAAPTAGAVPASPAAQPSAPPPAPALAEVRVSVPEGGVAWLVGASGRVELGQVPPGTYNLYTSLDGGKESQGQLDLQPGELERWTCKAGFGCKPGS